MTVALAAVVGFLGARLLWLLLAPVLAHPAFQRLNYRDKVVPTGAGIVIALVPVFAEAVRLVSGAAGVGTRHPPRCHRGQAQRCAGARNAA